MEFLDELRDLKVQVKYSAIIENVEVFNKIVIAGMGGSGIAGKIFSELYSGVPIVNVDDYRIPDFVDSSTLFIPMSYSGNTEEVLSATAQALKKGAEVVAFTSGGRLSEISKRVIKLPKGLQPRSSLGYMLLPLIRTFLDPQEEILDNAAGLLDEMDGDNSYIREEAEHIYREKAIPVIYGFSPYRNVAYRWRTQFNENSKVLAASSYFPELDHNEIVPLPSTYRSEIFRFYTFDCDMPEAIRKRIDATESVGGIKINRIEARGKSVIERLFYLIHYGDYLSYHLSIVRGKDPRDVTPIEKLKKMIS